MATIYDRKWAKRFEQPNGTPNTKAVKFWTVTLVKKGVTASGLRRCLEKTLDEYPHFAPTLPEILLMCQPSEEDLGIPNFDEAFFEATAGRGRFGPGSNGYWAWAHQTHWAVYNAVKNIKDKYAFAHLPSEQSRQVFFNAWEKVLNDIKAGKKLESPPQVIAPPEHKPVLPEEAQGAEEWIDKFYAILKKKPKK